MRVPRASGAASTAELRPFEFEWPRRSNPPAMTQRIHERLRQPFRKRSRRGRAAERAQQPAAPGIRPLCRASLGLRLHRAAARQPAKLAVPDAADRRPPRRSKPIPDAPLVRSARGQRAACSQPPALGPARPTFPKAPTSSTAWSPCFTRAQPEALEGCAMHLYRASRSMERRVFANADGELLIIPQQGALSDPHRAWRDRCRAGIGRARPARHQVPRSSCPTAKRAAMSPKITAFRFRLPDLGPIGANGLANARDFETPVAAVRGRGRADRGRPEISRATCGRRRSTIRRSMSSPGTAITRRGAMTLPASTRSAASASIIPTRRSSPS